MSQARIQTYFDICTVRSGLDLFCPLIFARDMSADRLKSKRVIYVICQALKRSLKQKMGKIQLVQKS